MEDFVFVDVLEAHADLEKKLPDFFLFEIFFVLLLEIVGEIAAIAVFHDNIESAVLNKGILISDDEGVIKFAHNGGFVDGLR